MKVWCVFHDNLENGNYYKTLNDIFMNKEDVESCINNKSNPEQYHKEEWEIR